MPTYDYHCTSCNSYTEHIVRYDDRHDAQVCRTCTKQKAEYVMTMPHTRVFEPYHDEALNCDIHGERHRQQVLAAEGLHESGDRVGGAREFDASNPGNAGVMPLQGISHDDNRRNTDKRRRQAGEMVVGVDTKNAYGEVKTSWHRTKDLESKAETKPPSIREAINQG